ncbi:hypothetical protein N9A64_06630, partial [Pseudomonadales bacterium]|nr:hypothetical protein [Pseudomonadales bacterium]
MKIQRRTLLKGGLAAAAQYMVSCSKAGQLLNGSERSLIDFRSVPFSIDSGTMPIISEDYEYEVL